MSAGVQDKTIDYRVSTFKVHDANQSIISAWNIHQTKARAATNPSNPPPTCSDEADDLLEVVDDGADPLAVADAPELVPVVVGAPMAAVGGTIVAASEIAAEFLSEEIQMEIADFDQFSHRIELAVIATILTPK